MSGVLYFERRSNVDETYLNKLIVFGILLLITAYILQMLTPILVWVVGLLIALRVFLAVQKHK